MRKFFILIVPALLLLSSCNAISSLIHDDQVVAKVGKEKLYKSELERYLPDMVSGEDSVKLAERYIYSWAMDRLYLDVAESELSKTEIDVSDELEAYRSSLVKYRYEQRYINDRLDTLVTDSQINEYYEAHKDEYILKRPVMKVRFLHIMKDAQGVEEMIKLMCSDEYSDLEQLDTMVKSKALRYFDKSDTWMDASLVSKEFGLEYKEMLSAINKNLIRLEFKDRGDLMAAYVCDIQKEGYEPLDYCAPQIKDIILSNRKRDLVNSLERDLLDNALESKKFEIYEDE